MAVGINWRFIVLLTGANVGTGVLDATTLIFGITTANALSLAITKPIINPITNPADFVCFTTGILHPDCKKSQKIR